MSAVEQGCHASPPRLYLVVIFGALFFRFGALDSVLGSSVQYYKSRKTKNRLNLFQRSKLKWRFISLTTFHNKFWSGRHFCIVLKVIEGLREIMLDFIFIRVYIYSWLSRCCKARGSSIKVLPGGHSKVGSFKFCFIQLHYQINDNHHELRRSPWI